MWSATQDEQHFHLGSRYIESRGLARSETRGEERIIGTQGPEMFPGQVFGRRLLHTRRFEEIKNGPPCTVVDPEAEGVPDKYGRFHKINTGAVPDKEEFSNMASSTGSIGEKQIHKLNDRAKVSRCPSIETTHKWEMFEYKVRTLEENRAAIISNSESQYLQAGLLQIRHRYGCYDEISNTKGRHCNWVRFLRASPTYSEEVNVIGTRVKGEPIFEVVKNIPANTELIVFFLPERPEEVFFMPAVNYLRNSLYRRTMDTILEDSPLDLSTSLLSRVMIPSPGSTSSSPPSLGGDADERKSPVTSSETSSTAGDILENLKHTTHSQALNEALNLRHTGSDMFNELGVEAWKSRPDFHPRAQIFGNGDVLIGRQQKIRTQRGERNLLPCEVCGKAFDRPSLLKRHMRTHTGEKPHVCLVCNKGFSTSSSLNTHRRIHSGEKPHQCQVCGKRFTASSNLYYHRMTHIKEKPHKCTLCAKSFPTPGDLKSHMYVHNGSWPFKCHICNRGFSKHTNLKNHLFLHTGDKPHSCELCHKKFALACNLRAHMKTHEGDPQEECVRCGKVYLSSSNQINHGFCGNCYSANQGLPLIKEEQATSLHDSGSEDSNLPEEEEVE